MKNQLNWLMVVAAMAAATATSCSDEAVAPVATAGEEATVAFSVALPSGIGSRAYSDGKKATQLQYYVYDAGATTLVTKGTATFSSLTADVNLQLVTGKTYDVVFWADSYGSESTTPYSFDTETQSITVSYDVATSNEEARDAFFNHEVALKVDGPLTKTITLTRPFAQINFGTDDLTDDVPAVADIKETVVASVETKAYTKLNLMTGEASDEQSVTFDYARFPTGEDFPYQPGTSGSTVTPDTSGDIGGTTTTTYSYVAMNYILVNAIDDKGLVDITLNIKDNADATDVRNSILVPNAPVRRNYRTNIYGSLLTSTANINLSLAPAFTSPDNNYAELLLAAANGGTVTLSSNTTLTESLVIAEGKDVVVDLNSKTISLSTPSAAPAAYSRSGEAQPVIVVKGNLTLIGNGSKGKVGVSTATDVPVISVASTGKLAIDGGTYYGLLTKEDGGSITVSEGTFVGFNPGAESANYVTEGSTAVEVDTDEYTVVKNTTDAAEAKTTLSTTNAVVVVTEDMVATSWSAGKNATLVIKSGVTLSGDDSKPQTINVGSGKSLTIDGGGTIVAPAYAKANSGAIWVAYGTLTINGDITVTNKAACETTKIYAPIYHNGYGGKINIYGGHYYAYNKANGTACPCIYLNGNKYSTSSPGAYLNIYGGVYESEASNPQLIDVVDGTSSATYNHINIYGGTFVGFNPANGDSAAGITTFVADGYEAVQTTYNGKEAWTVQEKTTTTE